MIAHPQSNGACFPVKGKGYPDIMVDELLIQSVVKGTYRRY